MSDEQAVQLLEAALVNLKVGSKDAALEQINRALRKLGASPASLYIKTGAITDSTGVAIGNQIEQTISIDSPTATQITQHVTTLFEQLDALAAEKEAVTPEVAADAKDEVAMMGPQLEEPEPSEPEVRWIEQRLRNIARMGPDILNVVTATLANPAVGLALTVRKIANKAREEAGLEPV